MARISNGRFSISDSEYTLMNKPILRLWFTDMWCHGVYQFNPTDNYFTSLFSIAYEVQLDEVQPDLLVYSCFGRNHLKYTCKKIFFSGENIQTNPSIPVDPCYEECDLYLGKYPTGDKNLYLPLWVIFVNWFSLFQPRPLPSNPTYSIPLTSLLSDAGQRSLPGWNDRSDLLFINNNFIKNRVRLFLDLDPHVNIDSFGSLFNNQDGCLRGHELDKHKLLLKYKTTIAMENSSFPGYNTEKIIQPYAAGCVPIYSGGLDTAIFNSRAMVVADNFSRSSLLQEVLRVISDPLYWESYIRQPLFVSNKLPEYLLPEYVLSWVQNRL